MNLAIAEASGLLKNKIVMEFLHQQALEKVAQELQSKGLTCTAKAVEVLSYKHKNIKERLQQYIAIGVVGCLMSKYK